MLNRLFPSRGFARSRTDLSEASGSGIMGGHNAPRIECARREWHDHERTNSMDAIVVSEAIEHSRPGLSEQREDWSSGVLRTLYLLVALEAG